MIGFNKYKSTLVLVVIIGNNAKLNNYYMVILWFRMTQSFKVSAPGYGASV